MAPPPAFVQPHMNAKRTLGFVFMCVGMFMAILDIQIVSSSLSEIQAGLSASASEVSWVQTAYLIAEIVMIPLSGFLGRALSTRYLFSAAAAGFAITSIGCSTANTITEMIIWRGLQGFIGGGMIPSVFAAAFTIFPRNRQAMVSAIIGLIATLAPTIGPTIGGYLTSLFSWHWLFLVNVLPGIAVTLGTYFLVDWDKPHFALLDHFDYFGLATLALFLGSLEYVLEEGSANDWFQDETILIFAVLSVIAGVAFFWRVLNAKEPIVDIRAFNNRNFATGSLFSFMLGVGLYGLVYLYPVFLARVRGYDSLQIGETMFVTGIFMMITAPIAGQLAQRIDPRWMMAFGLSLFAVSCLELVPITKDWSFNELFIPQALRGVALMTSMIPVSMLALGTLPPERIKNASGLFNLTRNLGGAVGLAVITTVLNNRWDLHISRLHESVNWGRDVANERIAALSRGLTALGSNAEIGALKVLSQSVRREALVMAFSDVFLALAFLFGAIVLLVPLAQKPQARGGGGGGGH
ncbi:MAG: DHA2 family efflux MFS transporter permease subunit [Rhizobiales bacterium]|nr:DHA2 family efflux MFS transporter permease subunit [Hyphomicrobiales bacterium]